MSKNYFGRLARRLAASAAALAAGLILGCSDSAAAPPMPGTLNLTIVTPNADDRAVRLTISGGTVTAVEAPSGITILQGESPSGILALVFGNIRSGTTIHLTVPDVAKIANYRATIDEVSDAAHSLRPSLLSYSAVIAR